MTKLCVDLDPARAWICAHGIGHGAFARQLPGTACQMTVKHYRNGWPITEFPRDAIKNAEEICDDLRDRDLAFQCARGAWMDLEELLRIATDIFDKHKKKHHRKTIRNALEYCRDVQCRNQI